MSEPLSREQAVALIVASNLPGTTKDNLRLRANLTLLEIREQGFWDEEWAKKTQAEHEADWGRK